MWAQGSGKPYKDKSRSLLFNLYDKKNPNARIALLEQHVTPEKFLEMDIRLLASDEMLKQREAARAENMRDKRTDWDTEEVKA